MKYTLLELTQSVLSSISGDEVNSISDTAESRQVAEIIRQTYFNISARAHLPEHNKPKRLTASGDTDLPTMMTRPDDVARIEWIKYNKAETGDPDPDFQYVTILPFQQFMDMLQTFNPDETNIGSMTIDGNAYLYRNDKMPDYCAILQDGTVIFDSFNLDEESTLQSSNTFCECEIIPDFDLVDAFTPELDDQQFPLLLNEAKAVASIELRQQPNQAASMESRRQWVSLQRTKQLDKPSPLNQLAYFGRK